MNGWLATVTGWLFLLVGGLGLWRGIGPVRPGRTETHDSSATPGMLVAAESGGLALLGAALLLGGCWTLLALPAVVLMAVGVLPAIRRRRRRSSARTRTGDRTTPEEEANQPRPPPEGSGGDRRPA